MSWLHSLILAAVYAVVDLAVTVWVRERYRAKGYRAALDHVTYEAAADALRGRPHRDARDIVNKLRAEDGL